MRFAASVGMVARASQLPTVAPPGWWHCTQLTARYERTRHSSEAVASSPAAKAGSEFTPVTGAVK